MDEEIEEIDEDGEEHVYTTKKGKPKCSKGKSKGRSRQKSRSKSKSKGQSGSFRKKNAPKNQNNLESEESTRIKNQRGDAQDTEKVEDIADQKSIKKQLSTIG